MNHPWRQTLHVEPKTGWLNDPNGLCDYGRVHQLYYQSSPEDAAGGGKSAGPTGKARTSSIGRRKKRCCFPTFQRTAAGVFRQCGGAAR